MAATKIFEGGPATKNSFNKKRAVRGRAPPVFRICVIAPSFPPDIIIMFYSLSYTPAVFLFFSSSSSTGIPGGDFPGLAKTGKQSINS